jgi:hypothetical protein
LSAFTAEQLQAAAYMSLELFEYGFAICLVFFGLDIFSSAYLIVRSTFFPRIIGVLLAIEGLGLSDQQFHALSCACPGSPYLSLFYGYWNRGSSILPVAPGDGRERTTMEGTGQRCGGMAVVAHHAALIQSFA